VLLERSVARPFALSRKNTAADAACGYIATEVVVDEYGDMALPAPFPRMVERGTWTGHMLVDACFDRVDCADGVVAGVIVVVTVGNLLIVTREVARACVALQERRMWAGMAQKCGADYGGSRTILLGKHCVRAWANVLVAVAIQIELLVCYKRRRVPVKGSSVTLALSMAATGVCVVGLVGWNLCGREHYPTHAPVCAQVDEERA
jgi:hypothetical protein